MIAFESLEPRRVLSAGQFDPLFGNAGKVTFTDQFVKDAQAMAVQPDGKTLVAPHILLDANGEVLHFNVMRFNLDGSLDGSFGSNGIATINLGGDLEAITAMALQRDGKIVLTGFSVVNSDPNFHSRLALARLNADGSLDNSFSGDGKLVFSNVDTAFLGKSLWVDDNGTILATGADHDSNVAFVAQLTPGGQLNSSFGNAGIATIDFPNRFDAPRDIARDAQGRIVVVLNGSIARLTAAGALDHSFSGDGMRFLPAIGESVDLSITSNGKILLTFFFNGGTFPTVEQARLNNDGGEDTTLGGAAHDIVMNGFHGVIGSTVMQPDGKLICLLIGTSRSGKQAIRICRIDPLSGAYDTTFGDGGVTGTALISNFGAAALTPDRHLVFLTLKQNSLDTIDVTLGLARVLATDASPVNQFARVSSRGTLLVTGTSKSDRIIVGRRGDARFIEFDGEHTAFAAHLIKRVRIEGAGGDDFLQYIGSVAATISGGPGDDTLGGHNAFDVLIGGSGDDELLPTT